MLDTRSRAATSATVTNRDSFGCTLHHPSPQRERTPRASDGKVRPSHGVTGAASGPARARRQRPGGQAAHFVTTWPAVGPVRDANDRYSAPSASTTGRGDGYRAAKFAGGHGGR